MTTPPNRDSEFDQWLRESLSSGPAAGDARGEADVAAAVKMRARERRFRQRAVMLYFAVTAGVGLYVLATAGVPLPLNLGVNGLALAGGALGLIALARSRRAASQSSTRDDST